MRQSFLAILFVLPLALSSVVLGQMTSLTLETYAEHDGMVGDSDLSGFTTYRIYAELTSEEDFIPAVFGSDDYPMHLTTTTDFWQHPAAGELASSINPFMLGFLPELAFDSWLTIGIDQQPEPGTNEEPISTIGMLNEIEIFAAGGDILVNSQFGGSWFVLPGASNGFAGEDLKVLLGQFTTDGVMTAIVNVQVFIGGDPMDEQIVTMPLTGGLGGCTDSEACNYDAGATANDGSCWFPDFPYDCDGVCVNDVDEDGVCDENETLGCQDPEACNYDDGATDSGECTYPDAGMNCDGICWSDEDGDGVCDGAEVPGCQDPSACNFSGEATDDDGSCTFPTAGYDCDGVCIDDTDGDGVCDPFEVPGCLDPEADNYNAEATDDAGGCLYTGCLNPLACDFNPMANVSGPCTYAEDDYDCDGICLDDMDGDGVCDAFEVLGCTNELATNYDAMATDDDGSCAVDPAVYCGEGTEWDAVSGQCIVSSTGGGSGDVGVGGYGGACFGDFDADGNRGVSDLLLWLPVMGQNCEE